MIYVVLDYWDSGYTVSDSEASLSTALQEVAPGAVIELFQLELNVAQHGVSTTYYFHAGLNELTTDIVWAGQSYQALPIQAEGFELTGKGTLPRPTLRISNLSGTISSLITTLPEGLQGAKVTRIRTLRRFLDPVNFAGYDNILLEDSSRLLTEDSYFFKLEVIGVMSDPYAEFPRQVYYIDRLSLENRDIIEFELASVFDLAGVRAPKRQCVTRCQWKYRSAECGYTGTNYFNINNEVVYQPSQDVCGKTVTSCEARFGTSAALPFGGFPSIGTYFT